MNELVDRMEQLQTANMVLDSALQDAWRFLPYEPEKAFKEFIKLSKRFQSLTKEWEKWLSDFEIFNTENQNDYRDLIKSILIQMEQFLFQGKGMALALLGRLEEAQEAYEKSMGILNFNPGPSQASQAEALGQLSLQRAKFDEAEQYFRSAYETHVRFSTPEAWKDIVDPIDADNSALLSLKAAARVLGNLAEVALRRGDREAFFERQLKAIEFTNTHALPDLARSLGLTLYTWQLQWDVRGSFSDSLEKKLEEVEKNQEESEQAGFRIEKLFLEAENNIVRGSRIGAKILLNNIREILKKDPGSFDKWWKLHISFAGYHEWQEEIELAMEHTKKALEIAQNMGVPDRIQQSIDTLVRISSVDKAKPEHSLWAKQQLDNVIVTLRKIETGEALIQALMQRAITYFVPLKQYEEALADISEAEPIVRTRDVKQQLLSAKAAVLKLSGNKEEALVKLQSAIHLCLEQMLPKGQPSAQNYRDFLRQTEMLHEGAAHLVAELGRVGEAFDFVEKGKTILLRQQLSQSGINSDDVFQIPLVSYDENLRQVLKEESAAFLIFCVGMNRTLTLILDPKENAPKDFFVDLKEKDLEETKLAKGLWPSSDISEQEFIQFLSLLSEKLLTPITDVLQDIMSRCEVLYIVPDSRLYLVPFSALTMKGKPLVEHKNCTLALTPSVAIWQWCRQRRLTGQESSCMVIAAGRANEFSFADQARAIMDGLKWKQAPSYLLDDEERVSAKRIWQMAGKHSVLHFSCHGMEEPATLDTLSALHIILSNNEKWFAKDVFNHRNELSAELVFLNVCMSGRFRLQEGVSIGGFWEGFLHAGAISIVATLSEVHPKDAQLLARTFYQKWLEGNHTKARALQLAQNEVRLKNPNSFQWARYILIGDHR